MDIGWPEAIWIGLIVLANLVAAVQHGKPKRENWDHPTTLAGSLIFFGLMYWGGFFS